MSTTNSKRPTAVILKPINCHRHISANVEDNPHKIRHDHRQYHSEQQQQWKLRKKIIRHPQGTETIRPDIKQARAEKS